MIYEGFCVDPLTTDSFILTKEFPNKALKQNHMKYGDNVIFMIDRLQIEKE